LKNNSEQSDKISEPAKGIPKKIHYCWLSSDPYPEPIVQCIASWHLALPEYEFVLWDRKKTENITGKWLNQSLAAKKYAFAADFVRIYALFTEGGIYLDSDVEVISTLNPFLKSRFFIGYEYGGDLEPAIFGSEAGHPFLKSLLDYYQDRPFLKSNGTLDTKPLPLIFNDIARKTYGIFTDRGKVVLLQDGMTIYPHDFFSPKNYYFSKITTTINTVSIHHLLGSWIEKDPRYLLKRRLHQLLYILGGKSFHNFITKAIRIR
jgi:mannosyltransferase OCH1-like enzyme